MSVREVRVCDRCGDEGDQSEELRTKWGQAYAATFAGLDVVGRRETAADLCGGCMADLVLFMGGADQVPAPPRRKKHGATKG